MSGYTMMEQVKIADKATEDICTFLSVIPTVVGIINVEDSEYYREKDIDLVVVSNKGDVTKPILVEIKGDTYHHTGNYFFETFSNAEKGTEGCFLYTEADFLFYYYVEVQELHILPMKATRKWFIENVNLFTTKETKTQVGNHDYTTVGELVPRYKLLEEVEGVQIHKLKDFLKEEKHE